MTPTWKAFAAFAGIFIAGSVAGGFVGVRWSQAITERRWDFEPQTVRRLTEKLDLTPEQLLKIKPMIAKADDEIRTLRRDSGRATIVILDRMEEELSKELTAEQRDKLTEMQKKRREDMQKRMNERSKRGGDQRGDSKSGPPPSPGGPEGVGMPPPPNAPKTPPSEPRP